MLFYCPEASWMTALSFDWANSFFWVFSLSFWRFSRRPGKVSEMGCRIALRVWRWFQRNCQFCLQIRIPSELVEVGPQYKNADFVMIVVIRRSWERDSNLQPCPNNVVLPTLPLSVSTCDRSFSDPQTPRSLNNAITARFCLFCAASWIERFWGRGRLRSVDSSSESEVSGIVTIFEINQVECRQIDETIDCKLSTDRQNRDYKSAEHILGTTSLLWAPVPPIQYYPSYVYISSLFVYLATVQWLLHSSVQCLVVPTKSRISDKNLVSCQCTAKQRPPV